MYEQYLNRKFNRQTSDCCHLSADFLLNELGLLSTKEKMDNVSRDYDPKKADEVISNVAEDCEFIHTKDLNYKRGDLIVYRNRIFGCCAVCVDEYTALTMGKYGKLIFIKDIKNITDHLRSKFLIDTED